MGYRHNYQNGYGQAKGGAKGAWQPRRAPSPAPAHDNTLTAKIDMMLSDNDWRNWKDYEKEEAEKRKEEERKLKEARAVELEERKKDREEVRLTMKEQNTSVATVLQSMTNMMKSWGRRGALDDEDDGADPPPVKRRRRSSPAPSNDGNGSDDDDGEDWKSKLAAKRGGKGPRKQVVKPPVDPDEWDSWTCSIAEGKSIVKHLKVKEEPKNLKSKMLDEVVDAIVSQKSLPQWKAAYKKLSGEDAKARWARNDVCAAAIAAALEQN